MVLMAPLSPGYRVVLLGLLLCIPLAFSSCSLKDRFQLTVKDVDTTGPNSLGEGYGWSFGNLGSTMNGHGLPDHAVTFVITHKSADGKYELIWPNFIYGNDQANAAVLDDTVVFMASLPDGKTVLMADKPGEAPMVISAAVLRLAAQKLGTSVIKPDTDFNFLKVRQPPDRIWLQGMAASSKYFPGEQPFTVELTSDDLKQVMDETRKAGKTYAAGKFNYLAEDGIPAGITSADVTRLKIPEVVTNSPAAASFHKTTGYVPQAERLNSGEVLLDEANGYVYFSTVHEPARILKVALGNEPNTAPVVVGAVVLEGDEDNTFHAVLDPRGGYAYFGTDGARVVKIALGKGNEPPYRVGAVLLEKEENTGVGMMDAATGYLYFNCKDQFYKMKPGDGDAAPSIISSLALPNGTMNLASAIMDPVTHHAYLGSDGREVYKVTLNGGDTPMELVGKLILPDGEGGLRGAIIDPQAGSAWFTSDNGSIVTISPGKGDEPPQQAGTLKLDPKFMYLEYTFGKDDQGFAYYGTMDGGEATGAVLKVALGKNGDPPQFVSYLPMPRGYTIESGVVDPVRRILCLGVDSTTDRPGDACCKIVKLDLGQGTAAPRIVSETALGK